MALAVRYVVRGGLVRMIPGFVVIGNVPVKERMLLRGPGKHFKREGSPNRGMAYEIESPDVQTGVRPSF